MFIYICFISFIKYYKIIKFCFNLQITSKLSIFHNFNSVISYDELLGKMSSRVNESDVYLHHFPLAQEYIFHSSSTEKTA